MENISVIPKDIFDAISNNKRDVQSTMLSFAHAAIESSFIPDAVGFAGEIELFQLKPTTAVEVAKQLGFGTISVGDMRERLKDPAFNTQLEQPTCKT